MTDKYTPNIELESKTFSLNLNDFRKFLVDNNLIVSVVGFAVGWYLKDLIESFFQNIILCEDNLDVVINYNICILNIKMYPGKFILSFVRFLVSTLLVFYVARFLNDLINFFYLFKIFELYICILNLYIMKIY